MSAIVALATNGWNLEQLWNLDGGIHAWSEKLTRQCHDTEKRAYLLNTYARLKST